MSLNTLNESHVIADWIWRKEVGKQLYLHTHAPYWSDSCQEPCQVCHFFPQSCPFPLLSGAGQDSRRSSKGKGKDDSSPFPQLWVHVPGENWGSVGTRNFGFCGEDTIHAPNPALCCGGTNAEWTWHSWAGDRCVRTQHLAHGQGVTKGCPYWAAKGKREGRWACRPLSSRFALLLSP